MSDVVIGTVKWYNPDKAYGFIATPDGRDVFVHRKALADGRPWLVDGQEVSLRIRVGAKGPEADEVRVTRDVEEIPAGRMRSYRGVPRWEGRARFGARGADRPRRDREPYRGPIPSGPIVASVVRVDPEGRFLFVKAEVEGFDVYVHSSLFGQRGSDFREGDRVRVVVEQGERGLRARTMLPM